MATPWAAHRYDVSSEPQQAWASEVLARLERIPEDAKVVTGVERGASSERE